MESLQAGRCRFGGHRCGWRVPAARRGRRPARPPRGIAILLHYTAMRLSAELRAISEQLPVDLGVMGAATGQALMLLLEVCTVRSTDDPRAGVVHRVPRRRLDHLPVPAVAGCLCRGVAAHPWSGRSRVNSRSALPGRIRKSMPKSTLRSSSGP